ncbi:hypothetical protein EVAR_3830_1 [Eumeta japonica]|uniref:Uncharacterized protein n=1 Tax=Eumeta variegata TaxID=151549 RepID=A0A4C1SQE1_EUMVA|nr:hypothetical protein EVAR_3830_1 [Eumeta japonica]
MYRGRFLVVLRGSKAEYQAANGESRLRSISAIRLFTDLECVDIEFTKTAQRDGEIGGVRNIVLEENGMNKLVRNDEE